MVSESSSTDALTSTAPSPLSSPALADHSRFVQRIRRRYDKELALLP
ncbi:MAG: hypothetical protein RLZZ618_3355, partial [Pseudomonadota bacterium]